MEEAASDPVTTGVLLDFDGTLSPIVDDPAQARPVEGAVETLAALVDTVGLVAVISGRPVEYLAEHLTKTGAGNRLRLHGLYGLEHSTAEGIRSSPGAGRWRQAVDDAARAAHTELPEVHVEHKGLTVTLHYRSIPDDGPAIEAAAQAIAERSGLVAHPGKMSIELRPPLTVDKGTVVRQLAVGLSTVAFAGDDMGDLPAYAALRDLRADGLTTLSIAAGGAETPAPVLDAADVTVQGPVGVLDLLELVISRLRR